MSKLGSAMWTSSISCGGMRPEIIAESWVDCAMTGEKYRLKQSTGCFSGPRTLMLAGEEKILSGVSAWSLDSGPSSVGWRVLVQSRLRSLQDSCRTKIAADTTNEEWACLFQRGLPSSLLLQGNNMLASSHLEVMQAR